MQLHLLHCATFLGTVCIALYSVLPIYMNMHVFHLHLSEYLFLNSFIVDFSAFAVACQISLCTRIAFGL